MHQDQVSEPANGFSIIAGSLFCPHAITAKDNHILTIQAHPEFEPDFFIQLCERLRGRTSDTLIEQAQDAVNKTGAGDQDRIQRTIHSLLLSGSRLSER